jgi:anti-anti-sigma factor
MKPDNRACAAAASAAGRQALVGSAVRAGKAVTMTLEVSPRNGAVVIHCQGAVMFRREARHLSNMITEALPIARQMVVDLKGVLSVHSEALGELVLTHMWAEAAGFTLKFACPSEAVQQTLETTHLISVLDVYASVSDALTAMQLDEASTA